MSTDKADIITIVIINRKFKLLCKNYLIYLSHCTYIAETLFDSNYSLIKQIALHNNYFVKY